MAVSYSTIAGVEYHMVVGWDVESQTSGAKNNSTEPRELQTIREGFSLARNRMSDQTSGDDRQRVKRKQE